MEEIVIKLKNKPHIVLGEDHITFDQKTIYAPPFEYTIDNFKLWPKRKKQRVLCVALYVELPTLVVEELLSQIK